MHGFRARVQIKRDLFIAARDPTIDRPGGIRGAECQYSPFSLHRCVCVLRVLFSDTQSGTWEPGLHDLDLRFR